MLPSRYNSHSLLSWLNDPVSMTDILLFCNSKYFSKCSPINVPLLTVVNWLPSRFNVHSSVSSLNDPGSMTDILLLIKRNFVSVCSPVKEFV